MFVLIHFTGVENQKGGVGAACAYLEARVGDESGVIAQVGGVVLYHSLRLRLAEVLVGRRETTGRQHHRGRLWGRRRQSGLRC